MTKIIINIADQYTRFPTGRLKSNGNTSGEGFREQFLEPPLRAGKHICVELDGTIGYGSSFLEEAFGGLVRSLGINAARLKELMDLKSDDSLLITEINAYIDEEDARRK